MNAILEQMASDIALLSNESLSKLADILVNEYPSRADSLQNFLCWAEFDQHEEVA